MKEIKDAQGHNWSVNITVDAVKRVRDLCDGIDLLSLATPGNDLFKKLEDPCTLVSVLYAVCQPQIEKLDLTPEDFAGGFNGDAIEDAAEALTTDIIDFFPERKRRILHKAFQKVRTVGEKRVQMGYDKALREIDSPEFDQKLEAAFAKISGQ